MENVNDPIFSSILKYKKRPSILAIQKNLRIINFFSLKQALTMLKIKYKDQIKIIYLNSLIFLRGVSKKIQIFLLTFMCYKSTVIPSSFKLADVTPLYKKRKKEIKKAIDQLYNTNFIKVF